MFKKFLTILILISNLAFLNGAIVDIDADVYSEYTLFTYKFKFNENDGYRSFSFERPSDSQVDFVKNSLGEDVRYSVAGDYYILQPSNTKGEFFEVRFTSKKTSLEIFEKGSFSVYGNFNFVIDELNFNFELIDEVGEMETYFPRDFQVLEGGAILWNLHNVETEELFRIEFDNVVDLESSEKEAFWTSNMVIIISGIVLFSVLILIVFFVFFTGKIKIKLTGLKKKSSKAAKKAIKPSKVSDKSVLTVEVDSDLDIKDEKDEDLLEEDEISNSGGETSEFLDEEKYNEIVSKFLTENEKQVVSVVKNNEGVSQYDILNFLPSLTKSNLSKIISKLDNKQILKRIRVGKVNKIYLGSKLEKDIVVKKDTE